MQFELKVISPSLKYMDDIKRIRKVLETVGYLKATDIELQRVYEDFSKDMASASWLNISDKDVELAIQILKLRCEDENKYEEFYAGIEVRNWLVDFVQYLLDRQKYV